MVILHITFLLDSFTYLGFDVNFAFGRLTNITYKSNFLPERDGSEWHFNIFQKVYKWTNHDDGAAVVANHPALSQESVVNISWIAIINYTQLNLISKSKFTCRKSIAQLTTISLRLYIIHFWAAVDHY